ncbi:hypothetical protein DB345_01810 [Spartobacteria bacterium LR76]|nr:hypothetical protein DB345_01810 [Spartobacteria bacterium LR76]
MKSPSRLFNTPQKADSLWSLPAAHHMMTAAAIAIAALSGAGASSAQAADAAWNVNADGSWVTDANWNPAAVPGSTSSTISTDTATFGSVITAARAVTLDTNRNIFGINFSGNSFAYTLSGGNLLLTAGGIIQTSGAGTAHTDSVTSAIALQGDATFTAGSTTAARLLSIGGSVTSSATSGTTTLTLNGANTGANTITGVISNGGGTNKVALAKSGTGLWTLAGANTYSGGTSISAGTIQFSNNNSFGTGSVTSNGGTIRASAGVTTTNNLVVNAATTLDVSGGNWNLNGNISGSGNITRGTSATLTLYLGGDNSGYTGTFTTQANGNSIVRFNSASAGSANASWVFNNTTVNRNTASFSTGTISFGSMTGNGVVSGDIAGTKTISAGALGLADTFSGVIQNGVNSSVIAFTKVGSGTMTLSGTNTYTGATTVTAGTLLVNGSLASGSAVSVTGGTLGGAGNGTTTGVIGGATALSAGAKLSPGTVAGSAGTLTFSNGLDLSASSNNTGAYLFNLDTVGSSDKITITSLTANALNVGILDGADFTFTKGGGFGEGTYTLFNASSAIAGSIGTATVDLGGGYVGTLSIDNVNNDVLLTVVPEPSTYMLMGLGLTLLLWRKRRMLA